MKVKRVSARGTSIREVELDPRRLRRVRRYRVVQRRRRLRVAAELRRHLRDHAERRAGRRRPRWPEPPRERPGGLHGDHPAVLGVTAIAYLRPPGRELS